MGDIHGVLNGTITGSNSSTMTATITQVSPLHSFSALLPSSAVQLNTSALLLAPGGTNGGMTTLTAFISTTIPEPSTIALFGVVLAVAGVHRVRARRRAGCPDRCAVSGYGR